MNNENNKSAKYLMIASEGGEVEVFNGDNFDETFKYAVELIESEQLQKGVDILEFLAGLRPDDPLVLKELALALIINDEPEDSLQFIERLNGLWPDHAITAAFLGIAYEKLGRESDATQALEKALTKNPTDIDSIKAVIALSMRLKKQLTESEQLVRKIQKTNPDDHFVWLALGNIQRLQGDRLGAFLTLIRATETAQTDIELQKTMNLLSKLEAEQAADIKYHKRTNPQ
jgi:tetratricopeptide (TPR) repeat protein